jgi:hypothetical protein
LKDLDEVARRARTTGRDYGDGNRIGNKLRQLAIKTRSGAVAVHGGKQDLSGAAGGCFLRPLQRIAAGRSAASGNEDLKIMASSAGIDCDYNRLRTETSRDLPDQSRFFYGGRIDGDLVGSRVEHGFRVSEIADSPTDGEGDEQVPRRPGNDVEHGVALTARGSDIEKDNFVRTIASVGGGAFGRVSGIAEINELHAFHDATAIHIETGDDAFSEHLLNLFDIQRAEIL